MVKTPTATDARDCSFERFGFYHPGTGARRGKVRSLRDPVARGGNCLMDRRRTLIRRVFEQLLSTLGPQYWWPADGPFEVIVGAILTQNTAWRNVKLAIGKLRERDLLTAGAISAVPLCRTGPADSLFRLLQPKSPKTESLLRTSSESLAGQSQRFSFPGHGKAAHGTSRPAWNRPGDCRQHHPLRRPGSHLLLWTPILIASSTVMAGFLSP